MPASTEKAQDGPAQSVDKQQLNKVVERQSQKAVNIAPDKPRHHERPREHRIVAGVVCSTHLRRP